MGDSLFPGRDKLSAVSWCVGERIDLRTLERSESLSLSPLTVRAGRCGIAVMFRYGAVVLLEMDETEQLDFLERLRVFVSAPFDEPESDEAEIRIDPDLAERADPEGSVVLREGTLERLQIVAHILAKSAVLAHYEREVADVLNRVEPLAERMRRSGRSGVQSRSVLREIGDALLIQMRTVGRAEVCEQPEMTWDAPELERLYAHLSEEYDLRERDLILGRKVELFSRTAQTFLDLLHNRRSLRVEWYIVALIAVEIVLIVYDIFAAR